AHVAHVLNLSMAAVRRKGAPPRPVRRGPWLSWQRDRLVASLREIAGVVVYPGAGRNSRLKIVSVHWWFGHGLVLRQLSDPRRLRRAGPRSGSACVRRARLRRAGPQWLGRSLRRGVRVAR